MILLLFDVPEHILAAKTFALCVDLGCFQAVLSECAPRGRRDWDVIATRFLLFRLRRFAFRNCCWLGS